MSPTTAAWSPVTSVLKFLFKTKLDPISVYRGSYNMLPHVCLKGDCSTFNCKASPKWGFDLKGKQWCGWTKDDLKLSILGVCVSVCIYLYVSMFFTVQIEPYWVSCRRQQLIPLLLVIQLSLYWLNHLVFHHSYHKNMLPDTALCIAEFVVAWVHMHKYQQPASILFLIYVLELNVSSQCKPQSCWGTLTVPKHMFIYPQNVNSHCIVLSVNWTNAGARLLTLCQSYFNAW